MVLSLEEFSRVTQGQIHCLDTSDLQQALRNYTIDSLLFDSRRLNEAETTAFFAIRTENNDGHKFIPALYDKGVRVFVCQKLPSELGKGAIYLKVDNTLKALQALGAYARQSFKGKVVAITGSNGKTIVKEWVRTLVGQDKRICFSPRSYNSQIGVPISLWQLDQNCEMGIFEAGISAPNQMQKLRELILPDLGLITNIGEAHGVNFSSISEKLDEKLKLFVGCKKLICSRDNEFLFEKVREFCALCSIELISYSTKEEARGLDLPFSDSASRENVVSSVVLCRQIGIKEEQIRERLPLLCPLDMRLQAKQSLGGSVLINDSYSLDITSLETALDYLNSQNQRLPRCVILSDLQEKSGDMYSLMQRIDSLLCNKGVSFLYGIGGDFAKYETAFETPHRFFASAEDFLKHQPLGELYNKALLVKGSRKAGLERISNALEVQNHQSILEVNLTALDENVKYFKSKLRNGTLLMGMVKASSYGCGGSEVACELERVNGADYLTVAFADEGVTLRENGVRLPIMVVTPEAEALEKICEYDLEPVVHNFDSLELVKHLPIRIHIKLDTGMHRLGFEFQDLRQLIDTVKRHENLRIASVFSHFACADDALSDDFTLRQINRFEQMSSQILQEFDYRILRHICNSAAISRFPQAQYDMVRLGIGMYGIGATEETQRHLRYVQRLQTRLSSVRVIQKGESVSYMRNFTAQKPTTIGVIPIGYADGLDRRLSQRAFKVWINGEFAPIVGNICMDMCMVDLSGINAKVGDRVVVFGEENPVENMAKCLDTISYEVFTSVSGRINRVYYHE